MAPAETTTGLSGGSWPAPGVRCGVRGRGGDLRLQPAPRGGMLRWPLGSGGLILPWQADLPRVLGPAWGTEGPKTPQARGLLRYLPPLKHSKSSEEAPVPDVPRREDRRARWACLSSSFSDLGVRLGSGGQVGGAFLKRLSLCRGQCPAHRRQVMGRSQP